MPIYEFHCEQCNTLYKFLSRRVNTESVPLCPTCRTATLKKRISLFSMNSGTRDSEKTDDSAFPQIDERKLESAMSMLASEAENIREDDPRQAAQLMRRFTEVTGLTLGPGLEEAMVRMERGDDIEKIEEEMGDALDGDEPLLFGAKTQKPGRRNPPRVDDILHEM